MIIADYAGPLHGRVQRTCQAFKVSLGVHLKVTPSHGIA